MAQRIFIACRSNHDLIKVANLACKEQIGREYDPMADYLRYVGVFDVTQNRKCQVLVDCDSTVTSSPREVYLSCYNTSWDNGETSLSRINPPQGLPQRLKKDFAWGKRGPAPNDEGLYQKDGGIRE
ncbi:hypothetical protein G7Y89_g8488 [Cudoniella acicularis]|uniref:Uncharacterized protein n=1 Tax=Cudoniella acicularis TaxID=354080 RepID=A0A8H4RIL0_9HELO|nr:hypothetical protein G7Y89_g8488 [Cudoniella acicularis]